MISNIPKSVKTIAYDFNQNEARKEYTKEIGIIVLDDGNIVARNDKNKDGNSDSESVDIV